MFRGVYFFIFLYCYITCVIAELPSDIKPCKQSDSDCLTKTVQWVFKTTIAGVPSLGIESTDPMHQDLIDAQLLSLKYTLKNSTIEGFKACQVKSVTASPDKPTVKFDIICPRLIMNGDYLVSGQLVGLPIEGKGDYTVDCKSYHLVVDVEQNIATGKDGTKHLTFKHAKFTAELLGGMTFDLRNLFDGKKELADPILKFANENWKEVAEELQGPVFNANIKTLMKNLNKLLKTIPAEKLILQ